MHVATSSPKKKGVISPRTLDAPELVSSSDHAGVKNAPIQGMRKISTLNMGDLMSMEAGVLVCKSYKLMGNGKGARPNAPAFHVFTVTDASLGGLLTNVFIILTSTHYL